MVAVLGPAWVVEQIERVVQVRVIAIEVAAEDSFVDFDIAVVGIGMAETGVAAFESYAFFELERGRPVGGCYLIALAVNPGYWLWRRRRL